MDEAPVAAYLPWVIRLLLLAALLLPLAVPRADIIGDEASYRACLALARSKPEEGFERAAGMVAMRVGAPARHCQSVALIGLGRYAEAAEMLEQVAEETRDPTLGIEALAQAGNVWVLAGDLQRAARVLGEAIRNRPGDPDLYIDRAIALAGIASHFEAIDDLNRAIELDPRRAEAFVFRATAYRIVDAPELALQDVEAALALKPGLTEALVERGILRRQAGNEAGARADWIAVLQRAPDSPAADAARDNIEKMDVKVR
jgi:tetratricopeptide (TPR) repeat protein